MPRIAICDDSKVELKYINQLIIEYAKLHPELNLFVKSFSSGQKLVSYIGQNGKFSIYILDIIMPTIDGITIGELIRKLDPYAIIVFITSSPDYAISSYSVHAFHYLLKPFNQKDLFSVLDRAFIKLEINQPKFQPVKTLEGMQAVLLHTIVYIEYKEHRIYYHLTNGSSIKSVTIRESFEQSTANLLKDNRFLKISVSFIINLSFVTSMCNNCFKLNGNISLPVSRNLLALCKKRYVEFLIEERNNSSV